MGSHYNQSMSSLYLQPELLNNPFFLIPLLKEHWDGFKYEELSIDILQARRFTHTEMLFLITLLPHHFYEHKILYPQLDTLLQYLTLQKPDAYNYSFYYKFPGYCPIYQTLIQDGPYSHEWALFFAVHPRLLAIQSWRIERLHYKEPNHPMILAMERYLAYSYAPHDNVIPFNIPHQPIDPVLANIIGRQSEGYYNVQALWNSIQSNLTSHEETPLFFE